MKIKAKIGHLPRKVPGAGSLHAMLHCISYSFVLMLPFMSFGELRCKGCCF